MQPIPCSLHRRFGLHPPVSAHLLPRGRPPTTHDVARAELLGALWSAYNPLTLTAGPADWQILGPVFDVLEDLTRQVEVGHLAEESDGPR